MTNSLTQLVENIRSCAITVEDYLNQLEEKFNRIEPQIQTFIPEADRFKRLHRDLADLIKKYPDPQSRPVLFGIPVAIKDLYHVDGFETRAGSKLPPELLKGEEGEVVKSLKAAGAIILGKTVTTEFAYFAPGPTRNPHNLDHTPGGSSSGSAAAVAAGLTPLAFGTQTIGSIIRPAAYCGVVGFKPSQGRISTSGIIPLAPSMDQVGIFTSDVESAKYISSILFKDWRNKTETAPNKFVIPEGPYLKNADITTLKHFESVCKLLTDSGFDIISMQMMNDFDEIVHNHKCLVAAESAIVHKEWFARFSNQYHPKTAELIRSGQAISSIELEQCRRSCSKLRDEIVGLMDNHNIEAILSPSAPSPAPFGLESTGDPVMNLPWTHAGLPVINIPSGMLSDKLPYGLQITGKYGFDEQLLQITKKIKKCIE
jgi:Asp-tRNA(Asn)/Glu-tRNA(Gln) amidotransferase A subunit family amidase